MDEKEQAAAEMLRAAMGRGIRASLRSTAGRLYEAAEAVRELESYVDRIGTTLANGRQPITAEWIVAEALTALHTNTPDLGNLARTAAEYNQHVPQLVPGPDDDQCRAIYANSRCTHEHLPGVSLCFTHLWATVRGRGVGNVYPLGSHEPSEVRLPRGAALVGENGVHWTRNGDRWHAGGPAGDGGLYSWRAVNGSDNDTGRELARLLPEYAL